MYSVQRVSRTPYSLKVVCLKQLLSLRVYKLQEDETTRGGLQAVIIAANPAAAIVESSFPHRSAVSFQWSLLSVLMRFMLPGLPKAIERVNVGAGVQTQQIWLQGLCYVTQREWGGHAPKRLTPARRLLKPTPPQDKSPMPALLCSRTKPKQHFYTWISYYFYLVKLNKKLRLYFLP